MKTKDKSSSRSKKQTKSFGQDRNTLLQNLQETKRELDMAQLGFNQSTDPDLIEFYLFEIDALRARHTYLLRRIKALESPQLSSVPSQLAPESPQTTQ